ncbi:MAG: hypothetical protein KDI27_13260, partial [Gammaproteobacteria bacterium]|nr:hypothetical protein [Gammaproteobacteria bacterium]
LGFFHSQFNSQSIFIVCPPWRSSGRVSGSGSLTNWKFQVILGLLDLGFNQANGIKNLNRSGEKTQHLSHIK